MEGVEDGLKYRGLRRWSQLNQWKHYEARLITYDVIMKNNGKVRDVRSLACKIKVLNGRVPGTWKWTITSQPY